MANACHARVAAVVVLLGVSSPGLASGQTPEDVATARSAAQSGARAYEQGRWAEALDLFTRAEKLHHALPHLLYMARAQWKLGRLVAAHELYQRISHEQLPDTASPAFVAAQDAARDELEQLAPLLPHLTVLLEDASGGASVSIDGRSLPNAAVGIPRPIDPGPHRVEVSRDGKLLDSVVVELDEAERETVTLTAPQSRAGDGGASHGGATRDEQPLSSQRSSGRLVPAYVAFGVGAIGIAGGTYFALRHFDKADEADDLYDSCLPRRCEQNVVGKLEELDSESRSAGTFAWVGYGLGAAGVTAGIVLLLTAPDDSNTERQAQVSAWLGLGRAGLHGRF